MQVIPGRRKETFIYIYDDYVYHVDCRYDNIFRCNTRRTTKCRGSVILQHDNSVHVLQEHNHPRSPFVKEQIEIKEEMLKLSRETSTGLKEIFDTISRSNPNIAQYLSFPSIRCSMHRERSKSRPPIPDTLASLCNILEHCDIIKNVYKGSLITDNGKTAIILSSNFLLEALSSATEIYVDGTFSVLPRIPHVVQLYSVHIRYMNTGIGTLFILCDMRTTTMYDALWDKIIQMVPQLKENVKFIMSDFEMAAVKLLSTKFPRAKLTGCWFHFNQAVLRQWRKLRLSNASKTVLSMTMTLPLLRPDMFQEAMSIIQIEADILSCEYPDILQFTSYLRRTWSNMASRISTYDCPIRTNNIVESFHNIAAQKLGTRNINIWTFLEKLADLITDQELDFRRLRNNVRPRRSHTRTNRERDIKIINAQKDLINKRLSVEEFLLMFTKNINIEGMEQTMSFDDAQSSEILQPADIELFTEKLDETFQIEEQTNIRRRRSRHVNTNLSSRIEERHISRRDTEDIENDSDEQVTTVTPAVIEMTQDGENSFNTQRTLTSEIMENTQTTQHESQSIAVTFDLETGISQTTQHDSQSINITSDFETGISQMIPHESQIINNTSDSETSSLNIQDSSIYEVPDDDYGHLYTTTNTNASRSTEEHLFHPVDWNIDTSEKNPDLNTCAVCYINKRTHLFTPCSHLVCCIDCIERLETNRCPICNQIYDNYILVLKP